MPTLKFLDPITGTYKAISGSPGPSPTPPLPSGVWGNPPLEMFGPASRSLNGRDVYVDTDGKLRARPDVIYGPDVNRLATDTLETYPLGTSVLSVTGALATSGGWPESASASVLTVKRYDTSGNPIGFQVWSRTNANAPSMMFRSGSSALWSPWQKVAGDDTGWIDGGAGATVFVADPTNFTLTASKIRRIGNESWLYIAGTMKVASTTTPGSGNITNILLGTVAPAYAGTSGIQHPLSVAATGRVLGGVIVSASVYIAAIGGSDALAVGEAITLSGSFLMN